MLFTETMTFFFFFTNLQTSRFVTIKQFKIQVVGELFLSQSSERFELHVLHVDLHFLFNTTDVGLIQSISVAYMLQPSWCWLKPSYLFAGASKCVQTKGGEAKLQGKELQGAVKSKK